MTRAKELTAACLLALASVFSIEDAQAGRKEEKEGYFTYTNEIDEMRFRMGEYKDIEGWLGLKTIGRFQALYQDDAYSLARPSAENPNPQPVELEIDPGFQTAWGSMDFLARFGDYMDVYWEYYLSSRPHPDQLQGNQGYMLMRGLPKDNILSPIFDFVNVKAGAFEVPFGDHIYRRTDNARGQRNYLVGNQLVDPRTTEIGVEVATKPTWFNAALGVTSGSIQGDQPEGHGTAVYGKVWGNITPRLRLSESLYWVDHSDNAPSVAGAGGTRSALFSTSRSGTPYGTVWGGGNAPGQISPGAGKKVFASQTDLTYFGDPVEIYANFGYNTDKDTNGSLPLEPTDTWMYWNAEAVFKIADPVYVAARYGQAIADKLQDRDTDGMAHRAQLGAGWWITDYVLFKAEYVWQELQDFEPQDGNISGVQAFRDPSFQGVISEVVFQF